MLKKIRKIFCKIGPLAFLFLTLVSGHISTFKTVIGKSIE